MWQRGYKYYFLQFQNNLDTLFTILHADQNTSHSIAWSFSHPWHKHTLNAPINHAMKGLNMIFCPFGSTTKSAISRRSRSYFNNTDVGCRKFSCYPLPRLPRPTWVRGGCILFKGRLPLHTHFHSSIRPVQHPRVFRCSLMRASPRQQILLHLVSSTFHWQHKSLWYWYIQMMGPWKQ